jgi:hypothetical protein
MRLRAGICEDAWENASGSPLTQNAVTTHHIRERGARILSINFILSRNCRKNFPPVADPVADMDSRFRKADVRSIKYCTFVTG